MKHPQSQKLLTALPALTNIVRRSALKAGDILLDYYEQLEILCVETKDNGSPVSQADKDAEDSIIQDLQDITPDVPIIGEESYNAGNAPDIEGADYFWLIDALDGTKSFLSGGEDFTVNIALIHKGQPALGVVYHPISGHLYAGSTASAATRWSEETGKDKNIEVRLPPSNGLTVISSQIHGHSPRFNALLEEFKVNKIIRRASSIKTCLIAEGKADIYPRLGATCEWDTAAAHAIINAAGGCVVQLDGTPLTYGHQNRQFLNPEFAASAVNWFAEDTLDEE